MAVANTEHLQGRARAHEEVGRWVVDVHAAPARVDVLGCDLAHEGLTDGRDLHATAALGHTGRAFQRPARGLLGHPIHRPEIFRVTV